MSEQTNKHFISGSTLQPTFFRRSGEDSQKTPNNLISILKNVPVQTHMNIDTMNKSKILTVHASDGEMNNAILAHHKFNTTHEQTTLIPHGGVQGTVRVQTNWIPVTNLNTGKTTNQHTKHILIKARKITKKVILNPFTKNMENALLLLKKTGQFNEKRVLSVNPGGKTCRNTVLVPKKPEEEKNGTIFTLDTASKNGNTLFRSNNSNCKNTVVTQNRSSLLRDKTISTQNISTSTFNKASLLTTTISTTKESNMENNSEEIATYDGINDVMTMAGINITEESNRILNATAEILDDTKSSSCGDRHLLEMSAIQARLISASAKMGLEEPCAEIASLISHAVEERLKNLVANLTVNVHHRLQSVKFNPSYYVTRDVKTQLKFLKEVDHFKQEQSKQIEKEQLLRAAASRIKNNTEKSTLKEKAKKIIQKEKALNEQRCADEVAMKAIGPPRKKINTDPANSYQFIHTPKVKRVVLRDLLFLLEQDRRNLSQEHLYRVFNS